MNKNWKQIATELAEALDPRTDEQTVNRALDKYKNAHASDRAEEITMLELLEDSKYLNRCLGAYLDYCKCDIEYKCYAPHKAIESHRKLMNKINLMHKQEEIESEE